MSEPNDFYLRCKGAQITKSEREYIRETAHKIKLQFVYPVFVNIGVAWGATMHCLRAGAPHAELFGVDVDYRKRKVARLDLLDPVEWLEGDSGIIHREFTSDIHLLFVDGCHYYGTVKADIDGWTPKVVPGGVVIFHDYKPESRDLNRFPELSSVAAAVEEWVDSIYFDAVGVNWMRLSAVDSLACFKRLAV